LHSNVIPISEEQVLEASHRRRMRRSIIHAAEMVAAAAVEAEVATVALGRTISSIRSQRSTRRKVCVPFPRK